MKREARSEQKSGQSPEPENLGNFLSFIKRRSEGAKLKVRPNGEMEKESFKNREKVRLEAAQPDAWQGGARKRKWNKEFQET